MTTEATSTYDIFRIYMISALLAVFLQWGTTGAAIMAIYLTPTRGKISDV